MYERVKDEIEIPWTGGRSTNLLNEEVTLILMIKIIYFCCILLNHIFVLPGGVDLIIFVYLILFALPGGVHSFIQERLCEWSTLVESLITVAKTQPPGSLFSIRQEERIKAKNQVLEERFNNTLKKQDQS